MTSSLQNTRAVRIDRVIIGLNVFFFSFSFFLLCIFLNYISNAISKVPPHSPPLPSPPIPIFWPWHSAVLEHIKFEIFSLLTFLMLSPFLVSPPKIPYPLPLPLFPTYSHSWSWHSPTLGYRAFTGPRAFPPIDDQLGHPLLHMKPWVTPCVLFGWWFCPWELWGYG